VLKQQDSHTIHSVYGFTPLEGWDQETVGWDLVDQLASNRRYHCHRQANQANGGLREANGGPRGHQLNQKKVRAGLILPEVGGNAGNGVQIGVGAAGPGVWCSFLHTHTLSLSLSLHTHTHTLSRSLSLSLILLSFCPSVLDNQPP
jgi:hypothetical protein